MILLNQFDTGGHTVKGICSLYNKEAEINLRCLICLECDMYLATTTKCETYRTLQSEVSK